MNNNKMQIRENFTMDNSATTFSERRGILISRTALLGTAAIFVCLLIGASLLIYNFAACSDLPVQTTSICDHHYHVNANFTPHHPAVATTASTTSSTSTTTTTTSTTFDNNVQSNSNQSTDNDGGGSDDGTNTSHINKNEYAADDVRLPKSVTPIAYDIKLIPFLVEDNFTFSGQVKIVIRINESCDNITLHAVAIKIHEAHVNLQGAADNLSLEVEKLFTVESKQFYVIKLKEVLVEGGIYVVHIKYDGILNDYLQGFYRSSYNVGNETRWLATTQFQPTDARRAFPCFDEPAYKATFNISIARPSNMVSLSNMPKLRSYVAVESNLPDFVWDIYQESVPMSTYLVAFVVCDFVNLTSGNFAVWTRSDAISSAAYSLDVGPKILRYLEEFFNIKYPLPKVEMIALPDFSAGAMENWGLITYRETAMLYEEGVSANSNKQRVATVVAHELAHQWFGNLVTPTWWTDLWLNEGFASYMEYLGVDAVEPTWKSMDQFVVNELQNVFSLDALSSSHPISIKVHNPEEINEIFDRISYGKGATIIRMMDHFLTTKIFKGGLTNYLNDKEYQSADQDDLWEFLTLEARRNHIFDNTTSVKEIMDTWTLQTGFPVVMVKRNYDNKSIDLKQERFMFIDPSSPTKEKAEKNPLWWIPITYTTSKESDFSNTKPTKWMKGTSSLIIDDLNVSNSHWIIANIQQTGYYRVNYDETNWKLITSHLQDKKAYNTIAPANRAQLIDDALNLARGGHLDYNIALDVTKYLVHETDYVPWKAAIGSLNFIDSMLIKNSDYDKFKKYSINLMEPIYNEIGFEDPKGSQMLTVYKRVDILTAACHLGYKNCVDNCIQKYYMWIHEANPDLNNPISPNLKNIVYCTAIKYGDQMEWEFAWDRFQKTSISSEKEILLSALGCSRETWILTRYLERSMSDEYGIRKQDVFRVFIAVSNNVIGQPIAFNYIRSNWKKMKEYLGSSMSNLNTILKYSTKRINSQYELDELKVFADIHLKDSGRTIQQAIERVEANIAWIETNYKTIVNWLGNVTLAS